MFPNERRNLLLLAQVKLRIAAILLLCAIGLAVWAWVARSRRIDAQVTQVPVSGRTAAQLAREQAIRLTPLVRLIGGPIDPRAGEQLFKVHCGPCHKGDRDMTGPALKGAIGHAPQPGILWFRMFLTREDSLVRVEHPYTMALRHSWGDMPWMHSELEMSEQELRNLLGWIWLNDE